MILSLTLNYRMSLFFSSLFYLSKSPIYIVLLNKMILHILQNANSRYFLLHLLYKISRNMQVVILLLKSTINYFLKLFFNKNIFINSLNISTIEICFISFFVEQNRSCLLSESISTDKINSLRNVLPPNSKN